MNHGRTRKEMKRDSESHYEGMAEQMADPKALERFRRPAYQARRMIRAKGEQISEDTAEHEAGKCWEEENKDNNTGSRH